MTRLWSMFASVCIGMAIGDAILWPMNPEKLGTVMFGALIMTVALAARGGKP